MDSEELRADPEVNIEMEEVNDLISELIDCQNIWEIQESLISVKKNDNQTSSQVCYNIFYILNFHLQYFLPIECFVESRKKIKY